MSEKRMTVEEWNGKLETEGIEWGESKQILWDWQNDRVELLKQIEELAERALFLNALEQAGVDNWEGYSHAYEILDEWKKETEDERNAK